MEQLPHIWETAMAGAPEAEEGTEVAMDVHMSLTTPVFSFSFSVKIADKLLAAGAIVGGVTLAVLPGFPTAGTRGRCGAKRLASTRASSSEHYAWFNFGFPQM